MTGAHANTLIYCFLLLVSNVSMCEVFQKERELDDEKRGRIINNVDLHVLSKQTHNIKDEWRDEGKVKSRLLVHSTHRHERNKIFNVVDSLFKNRSGSNKI